MTDMTPTLPPLGPLPEPHRKSGQQMSYDGWDKAHFDCFDPVQMQSYATAYGEQCARAAAEVAKYKINYMVVHEFAQYHRLDYNRTAEMVREALEAATPPAVEARDGWISDEKIMQFLAPWHVNGDEQDRQDLIAAVRCLLPVLFNPYTGAPRDARDIASDPHGILIVKPGAALSAAPAAPGPQAVAEPVATLLDFDIRSQIGTVDLHGEWMDLRVGDKLFATQPPTQQAAPAEWSGRDAYDGAREDLLIWKRRALEAERDLRAEKEVSSRLVAEINATNGPAFMGEPSHQQAEVEKVGPVGLLRGDGTFHWFPPYPGPFWKDILLYAAPQQASAQGEQAQQASAQPTQAAKERSPLDQTKVIHKGFSLFKYAQGTKECIAFNRGVRFAENHHGITDRASNTGQEKSS